jgi:hypothetical protein
MIGQSAKITREFVQQKLIPPSTYKIIPISGNAVNPVYS